MYQLHEFINGTFFKTFCRSRHSQSIGCRKAITCKTISWRIIADEHDRFCHCTCVLHNFCCLHFQACQVRNLSLHFSQQWFIVVGFFILSIITGLLAGSYPAFYLSSFQPVKVLKGRFTNSLSAVALRKGLVIFQFIISVVLIIASVVIMNQMKYLRSTDLGFAKDQQIVIPLRSTTAKNIYASLKNEIRS